MISPLQNPHVNTINLLVENDYSLRGEQLCQLIFWGLRIISQLSLSLDGRLIGQLLVAKNFLFALNYQVKRWQ